MLHINFEVLMLHIHFSIKISHAIFLGGNLNRFLRPINCAISGL